MLFKYFAVRSYFYIKENDYFKDFSLYHKFYAKQLFRVEFKCLFLIEESLQHFYRIYKVFVLKQIVSFIHVYIFTRIILFCRKIYGK